ncbi:MAG: DUF255 domain-containing protein [Candidatus Margulisiibacteriota bacterium]
MKLKTIFLYSLLVFFIIFFIFLFVFNGVNVIFSNSNLKNSPSHYLQQHDRDFVNWNIWSVETLKHAQEQNKPLFISIGFATCYWCHYIQREVYKHPVSSKIINRYFVPVLIDRHQLPEIDKLYMELMLHQMGSSGWPMIIVTTPDGIPLYFNRWSNRKDLMVALSNIRRDWMQDSDSVQKFANEWLDDYISIKEKKKLNPVISLDDNLSNFLELNLDLDFGGLLQQNKFPYFRNFVILKSLGYVSSSDISLLVNNVIKSPLFDFIEGGVHRYSSESDWTRPHYEKLLIDQVSFIQILIEQYLSFKDPIYLDYIEFNLAFILDHLKDPKGYFYTGVDSGDINQEGRYYFFNDQALEGISPSLFKQFTTLMNHSALALTSVYDLHQVNRKSLLLFRQNSKFKLKKDLFFSIIDNSLLLKTLYQVRNELGIKLYGDIEDALRLVLIDQVSNQRTLLESFYLYDVLSLYNNDLITNQLHAMIQSRLKSEFPYYKSDIFINERLLENDFLDDYHYDQILYFILKYFNHFKHDKSLSQVCESVRNLIYTPWYQLSLIDSYKKYCK